MEIRVHGRGGQGGVTCAKILAAAYARQGKSVQTFGDYAGERSGAPVRAYTRTSDGPITNRNKVYEPDHLVVLDPNLLGDATVAGLRPGGTLLLNTSAPPEEVAEQYPEFRLATVDATAIARRHGIGTRSVVIVNTTIVGAWARAMEIPLALMEETFAALGFLSNFDATREAYEAVSIRPALEHPTNGQERAATPEPALPEVEELSQHRESPPTGLPTGTWSSERPSYVEHLAPCNAWCPAGNDVIEFVQALARDGEELAAGILGATTPLAGVCGRVCPAPCMEGCNRREVDGAVNIRGLERWIAEQRPVGWSRPPRRRDALRVAIVGGGPAGLSAAYTLALAGEHATIFELEERLGGVLTTGIPGYRLPPEVVAREVEAILALGVDARCGERMTAERILELEREYDAVILATGLQRLRGLDVAGAELPEVQQGISFLHRVNLEGGVQLDGHVVVLGGGNTAMDCARSALRCGAEEVTVAYRRTLAEMPAIREEIEEAGHEGVRFMIQRQPVGFEGNGRLTALLLAEVEMGAPDESGRRSPIVTERVERVACEHVLLALGQSADNTLLPPESKIVDGRLRRTTARTRVFAAGDLATGDGTVAHAIGSGRRAADRALKALGRQREVFERPDRTRAVPITDIRVDHFERSAAARDVLELPVNRLTGFMEANRGLPDALEAHRCFSCGHCTRCDTCLVYCPEGVVRRAGLGYELDYTYCKGCGICVHECPRSAMEMGAS